MLEPILNKMPMLIFDSAPKGRRLLAANQTQQKFYILIQDYIFIL